MTTAHWLFAGFVGCVATFAGVYRIWIWQPKGTR